MKVREFRAAVWRLTLTMLVPTVSQYQPKLSCNLYLGNWWSGRHHWTTGKGALELVNNWKVSALRCTVVQCKNGKERVDFAQLLHSGSCYTVWKEDHWDDMEFIPHNAAVIAMIEDISFTVAEQINFCLDSVPAKPISCTRLFDRGGKYSLPFN